MQKSTETIEELENTQKQIIQQERLRALGEMASGVAHDFNNQLQMMLGFADLLANDPNHLRDYDKSLIRIEHIREAGIQAANVVSRLRSFYQPVSQDEPMVDIDLNKKIEQVISLAEPKWKDEALATGKSIQIEKDLATLPPILGNRGELQEVILNLLFNAVDAISGDGTITISTKADATHVFLTLQDTGTGMDEEACAHCLEPFFTTKGPQGTGLGLSVAHGIINRHSGTITVESKVGSGTIFTLAFPIHSELKRKTTAQLVKSNTSLLTILVVDDEPAIRQILSQNLQKRGHSVDTAAEGKSAIQLLEKNKYDLLITDRAMPGISGDDLACRAKELYSDMSVFMLTGFGEFIKCKDESITCVDKVLAKPITIEELCKAVSEIAE